MPFYTPLRYPGGKRRLASFVMRLLDTNGMYNIQYAEPYAGGASLALALLLEEYAATIHINDLSRPVYAFWHAVLNDTERLCERIDQSTLTIDEWRRQRAVYDNQETADLGDLGFATFFLNRTNRSGIIAGGVIGGKTQTGKWTLGARFTKPELIQRIRRIGRYKNRIQLYQMDALEFTLRVLPTLGRKSFTFYDPPYIDKGQDLYLSNYGVNDHRELSASVVQLEQPWVVTYDYEAATRNALYPLQRRLLYSLTYSAQTRLNGQEVMFLSDGLAVPWGAGSTVLMSARHSRYPVYGRMAMCDGVTP
jgi:DNA adenine methylase